MAYYEIMFRTLALYSSHVALLLREREIKQSCIHNPTYITLFTFHAAYLQFNEDVIMQRLTFVPFLCLFSAAGYAANQPAPPTATTPNKPAAQHSAGLAYGQQSVAPMQTVTAATPTTNATAPAPQTKTAPTAAGPTAQAKMPVATTPGAKTSDTLQNDKDKISYAIGIDMGTNLKAQNIEVNPDILARGLKDGLAGGQTLITQQEIANILATLQKQIITKREMDFKTQAEQNKNAGNAFLQANKTKTGVVTLPSGLQYKIITQGNGAQPTDKDTVTVNYVGTLLNGQEFDSSYRRGKPVTFPVAEMIPGWSEALKLMKAGSTWEIYVPASLAYGERGLTNGPIGPNQTLIFKINLVSVAKK